MELVRDKPKKYTVWLLLIATLFLIYPYINVFASELGGLVSEKLVGRSGVSNSYLVIGTAPELVTPSNLDIGMTPAISTLSARTARGIHSATLRGNVSDLNDFSSATVWFEWGYDTDYGNVVGTQTITSTGTYSTVITDISDSTVHYRFGTSADGINYGNDSTFSLAKTSVQTLVWLMPTVFAIFGIVVLFVLRGSPIAIIIAGVIIIIGVVLLANVAGTLW